jgi:hypothetical protein
LSGILSVELDTNFSEKAQVLLTILRFVTSMLVAMITLNGIKHFKKFILTSFNAFDYLFDKPF